MYRGLNVVASMATSARLGRSFPLVFPNSSIVSHHFGPDIKASEEVPTPSFDLRQREVHNHASDLHHG